jgi:CBS domain-containing protein
MGANMRTYSVTTVGPKDLEIVHRNVWCPHQRRTVKLGECPRCIEEPSNTAEEDTGHWIRSIMRKDVFCVRADISVDELVTLLVEHGFSGVPIVDAETRPVGVISTSDLLRARYEQLEDEEAGLGGLPSRRRTVAELMTKRPVVLDENATIEQASKLLAQHRIHRLPIVSSEGILVGTLSALDIVVWVAQRSA